MANWKNEFVPWSVKDNIILSSSNYSKHKSYIYDLSQDNIKNNIRAAILDCNKLELGFFSKCIFNNIDRICYHFVLKLIFTINNFTNNNTEETKSLIIYSSNSHPIYLNNWQDIYYFIELFLTLFLFSGDGRYLVKCKTAISYKSGQIGL